jgi:hypothetical protein
MSSKKDPKDVPIEEVLAQMTPDDLAKSLKIAPSKRAILGLSSDHLLKHNALIFHKGSSLSSAQRRMVQDRIAYGINKGTISTDQVAKEINIQGELIKITKDDSITK